VPLLLVASATAIITVTYSQAIGIRYIRVGRGFVLLLLRFLSGKRRFKTTILKQYPAERRSCPNQELLWKKPIKTFGPMRPSNSRAP
jgi:hypothetical protein